ncbi:HD-GYP domain-containing protein [Cohnella luojiensis]|uniref:HD-GYP domain-containing protein n=1 Tax=Cohnella luojiensis TaxID=652876 RepID=A0A4Y8LYS8_9BACL|nr:HD-GYP domain-containing protein [Cohnella luojiensis]TFE24536.1 HD-GYP domain-containing protein [Cohnella luojiensis]
MSLDNLLGKKSKHDVLNSAGLLLVPARVTIDEGYIRLLEQHHIHESEILIMGERAEAAPLSTAALVRQAAGYSKQLFDQVKSENRLPLDEITNELLPIVHQVSAHPDVFQLFESVKAKDEYTHQHNIGVGVLSTLIGKWMKLNDSDLTLLSMAATLHDVGKIHVSDDILMKPGKLTAEEFEEVKRHTTYGYEILKETAGLDPRVALIALQHHERLDGKGYPNGLKEHEIDPFSRIVAVADVFHAMSSKRPYHEPLPFHEIVNEMRKGSFGELDPKVVSVFLKMMIRHLIGSKVKLSDGRWGEVVYINPHDDTHPLVKVDDKFIDLSQARHIHIQEIVV